jgi:iron complex outermembrane receptor protein
MPLTFDNSQRAAGYSLLNAKIGYRRALPAEFQLDVAAGSKNLTGSTYYTMVFLNASYAGPPPNVYLPGPSSPTFFGQVNLSKSF